jgi:nitroreductase
VNHVTWEQEASSFGVGSSPEGNSYARKALVLVSIVAKKTLTHNGAENSNYPHDVEAATAYMFLEAYNHGLVMHVIGGFDTQKTRQLFKIPEGYDPVTIAAIGYYGNQEQSVAPAKSMEMSARIRRFVSGSVFIGTWGDSI